MSQENRTGVSEPVQNETTKKSRVSTALKFLSGMDALESGVRNSVAMDYEVARGVSTMAKKAFLEKSEESVVNSTSQDPDVRFRDAQKQFGVSDTEMKVRLKRSERMFNINLICLALFVTSSIIFMPRALSYGLFSAILFLMPAIAGTVMFAANLFKWGFWNYQLREKSLKPASFFFKNPGLWLPSGKFVSSKKVGAALALTLGLLMSPVSANAATENCTGSSGTTNYVLDTFSLPCGRDVYRNALETIFPDVGPLQTPTITTNANGYTTESNGQSAVAEAFMAFIVVLMTVAMAQMTWHILSLIVAAAHEGTSVAQKWSGIWVPMRLFFGAGILAPYVKGYCLAQVLVLYAALWGGSLGNIIWSAYINGLDNPKISSHATIPYITNALKGLEVGDACYRLVERQNTMANQAGATSSLSIPAQAPLSATLVLDNNVLNQDYVDKINDVFSYNFGMQQNKNSTISSANLYDATWDFGPVCGMVVLPVVTGQGAFSTYDQARMTAFNAFLKKMDEKNVALINKEVGAASDIPVDASADANDLAVAYQQAVADTYTAVAKAAQTFMDGVNNNNMSTFIQNAQTYGWMTSGSYYMNLSRMQGMVDEFLAIAPKSDSDRTHKVKDILDNESSVEQLLLENGASQDVMTKIVEAVSNAQNVDSTSTAKVSKELSRGSQTGNIAGLTIYNNTIGLDNPDTAMGKIIDFITNSLGKAVVWLVNGATGVDSTGSNSGSVVGGGASQGSELQNMTEFGQNVLTIAGTIFVIVTGLGVASKFAMGGGILKAAAGKVTSFVVGGAVSHLGETIMRAIFWAMGTMLVVGVLHAYILPMMPYIQFMLFGMSMLILVVEAVIAAPIWAFMHFRLDGQEFVGREQSTGYMLIFNLFLRIPLAMLGMLLSISVFNATMLVLSITFYPTVQSVCGDGGSGLIGSLVMLLIMSYMHYQIAIRSFSLISSVPARVSKWFGAGITDENEHNMMQNIGGFLVGQASQVGTRALAGAISPKKEQQQQKTKPAAPEASLSEQAAAARTSGAAGGASGAGEAGGSPEAGAGGAGVDAGGDSGNSGTVQNTAAGTAPETSTAAPASMPAGSIRAAGQSIIGNQENAGVVEALGGEEAAHKLVSDLEQSGDMSPRNINSIVSNFVENSSTVTGDKGDIEENAKKLLNQVKSNVSGT